MERNKLVRISKVLTFILILILLFVFLIWPKIINKDSTTKNDEEGISTNIPFKASDYDNSKMVQDYLNPTDEERAAITQKYGLGYSYFDGEGLHLVNISDVYTYEEDQLITDRWPNHKFTNAVVKPDMELREIIVAQTYLEIYVKDVSKKELKNYIKEIEDEYKHETSSGNPNSIYKAYNDDGNTVDITWKSEQGCIKYVFAQ